MGKRRGKGEGAIFQRSDGRWVGRLDLGYVNGRRKRKEVTGRTRRDVVEKLRALQLQHQQGLPVSLERQTVAQFFERWLHDVVSQRTRPATQEIYDKYVRLHLVPHIGHIQLNKLMPQHIQALLVAKRKSGLSASTVHHIRAVLRTALNQALRWGLVTRNVAELVDPPPVESRPLRVLTPEQAVRLLQAARGDRLEALYRVALALGLREGEALGLRWEDVDLDAGVLRVVMALQPIQGKLVLMPPKTHKSRRTLPLPPSLVIALRQHRLRQLEERLLAGSRWQEHGLVFCTTIGTPIHPRNLLRSFAALLQRAELPHMRFHDLRHSCATLLAAQGVPPRVAMEILGHSSIGTTMNIYTHVLDVSKRQAVSAMEQVLGDEEAI